MAKLKTGEAVLAAIVVAAGGVLAAIVSGAFDLRVARSPMNVEESEPVKVAPPPELNEKPRDTSEGEPRTAQPEQDEAPSAPLPTSTTTTVVELVGGKQIRASSVRWPLGTELRGYSAIGLTSPDIFLPIENLATVAVAERVPDPEGRLCRDHLKLAVELSNGRKLSLFTGGCNSFTVQEVGLSTAQKVYLKDVRQISF